MNKFIKLLLVISICLWSFCSKTETEKAEPPFPEDQFIKLYTESLLIRFSDLSYEKMDSSLITLYQKYGLTEEKYNQIEVWYKNRPDEWLEIITKVDEKIKELEADQNVKHEN